MVEYALIGSGFALAAALQPGPLQAFLFSSVAQNGWKRTLPASFSPLISDGPIALLSLLLISRMPDAALTALRAGGGLFLIYLAWSSYRQWRHQPGSETESGNPAPRTLLRAATVNLLNPNPYLGWSLVLGPALISAWQHSPVIGYTLIVSFYGTMVVALACIIALFGTTQFLGPAGRRALLLASSIILAALGVYQIAVSVVRVFQP